MGQNATWSGVSRAGPRSAISAALAPTGLVVQKTTASKVSR